jgi:hypothetical protein
MMYTPVTSAAAIAALLLDAPTPVTAVAVSVALLHLTYETTGLVRQFRAVNTRIVPTDPGAP